MTEKLEPSALARQRPVLVYLIYVSQQLRVWDGVVGYGVATLSVRAHARKQQISHAWC